jgi:hypothetical protein
LEVRVRAEAWWTRLGAAVAVAAACQASTTRPPFVPYPEAAHGEIGFGNPDRVATVIRATQVLAEALRADSIPVARVEERDGYLETRWFEASSLQPTSREPLGPDVVRVRAWVTPAKPGFGTIEVETVYRPLIDPSLPARELETPVPDDHPVGRRVADVVKKLVERYGEPAEPPPGVPRPQIRPAPGPPPVDTTRGRPPRDTLSLP